MVVEYMDRALVPTWTFLLETFLRPYPEAQTIVEPAVVSNLLTYFLSFDLFVLGMSGFRGFFGLLVLYLWLWCCLPCVRCFALSCVALRSFCVFRSG